MNEMIGYKILNEDLTCRDFKFDISQGVVNHLGNDEPLELCKNGFHFCEHPSGVWAYYSEGRVFRIKARDVLDTQFDPGADRKLVCRSVEFLEEVANTGDRNTGDYNTGDYNIGYRWAGSLNFGDAPIYLFNKVVEGGSAAVDTHLVCELGKLLAKDEPIDPTPFLSLPNASEAAIKRLHEAAKAARCRMRERGVTHE